MTSFTVNTVIASQIYSLHGKNWQLSILLKIRGIRIKPTVYPRQHVHMLRGVVPLKCGCNRIYLIINTKLSPLSHGQQQSTSFFTEGAPSYPPPPPPPTYWCVFYTWVFFTRGPAGGGRTVLSSYPVFFASVFLQGGLFPLPPPQPIFYTCFLQISFYRRYWTSSSYK